VVVDDDDHLVGSCGTVEDRFNARDGKAEAVRAMGAHEDGRRQPLGHGVTLSSANTGRWSLRPGSASRTVWTRNRLDTTTWSGRTRGSRAGHVRARPRPSSM